MAVAAEDIAAGATTSGAEAEEAEAEGKPNPPQPMSNTNVKVSIPIPSPVILVLGGGLIVASQITSATRLWRLIAHGEFDDTTSQDITKIGGEIIFVFVLAFLADLNAAMSQLIFAFILGLWLVWMVKNPGALQFIIGLPNYLQIVPGTPDLQLNPDPAKSVQQPPGTVQKPGKGNNNQRFNNPACPTDWEYDPLTKQCFHPFLSH